MDGIMEELNQLTLNLYEMLILQHANGQNITHIENLKTMSLNLKNKLEKCAQTLQLTEQEIDCALSNSYAFNKRLEYIKENLPKDSKIPRLIESKYRDNIDSEEVTPMVSPAGNYQMYEDDMITPGHYRQELSPYDYRNLARPLQTPSLAASPSQNEEMAIGSIINYISEEEFETVPAYMKGRMKVDVVNELIDIFNKVLDQKYEYIKYPRNKLKNSEKIYDIYPKWKQQQKENNNEFFCTEEDILILSNNKLTKKETNIITILRHLKRLRQTKTKDSVFYIICS